MSPIDSISPQPPLSADIPSPRETMTDVISQISTKYVSVETQTDAVNDDPAEKTVAQEPVSQVGHESRPPQTVSVADREELSSTVAVPASTVLPKLEPDSEATALLLLSPSALVADIDQT